MMYYSVYTANGIRHAFMSGSGWNWILPTASQHKRITRIR